MKPFYYRFNITIILLAALLILFTANCSQENGLQIKAPGVVEGEIVTLKALVSGTLQHVNFKEGETVSQDQRLAEIDAAKIENQIKELEINYRELQVQSEQLLKKQQFLTANIHYLTKQVQRFQRLQKKDAVAGEKLETMELKLKEAQTGHYELQKSLEALEIQREKITTKKEYLHLVLNDHQLKAPVKGIILEKFVSQGEMVVPGTAVTDILDMESLYVEIYIEEEEIGHLQLNQPALIHIDGVTQALDGTIELFGKKAEFSPKYILSEKERKSLLYLVKIRANDPQGILKIGLPVTVIIDKKGEAIPQG